MQRHKDDFVRAWGAPTKCTQLSVGELCEWYFDLGQGGGTYSVPVHNLYTGQVVSTISGSNTYNKYELVRIEFNHAQLAISGNCNVQY